MRIEGEFKKEDLDRIKRILDRLSPGKRGPAIVKGMQAVGIEVEAGLKLMIGGNPLHSITGRLRNSIESRVDLLPGNSIVAVIGSGVRRGKNVAYSAIHETGGTIKPKRAKYLTIPLKAAKTASGVARGKARDFANTFIKKVSSGDLLIFQNKGNGIIPLFVLKKSVKIPASRYMSKALASRSSRVVDVLLHTLEEEAQKA